MAQAGRNKVRRWAMVAMAGAAILGQVAPAQDQPAPAINLDLTRRADVGAVAQVMAALDLQALARAQGDAFAALAAARMMSDITPLPIVRRSAAADLPAFDLPKSGALFDLAKALTLDDALAELVETERGLPVFAPAMVRISPGRAGPGETDRWEIAFYAGALAEIAVVGGGSDVLDILITDSAGLVVCRQSGPRDRLYCPFVPRENGRFVVNVGNPGPRAADYGLLTN